MCFIIVTHAAASQKIKTRFYCNYSNWALNNTYIIKCIRMHSEKYFVETSYYNITL